VCRGLVSARDTGDAGRFLFSEAVDWCLRRERERGESGAWVVCTVRVTVPSFSRRSFNVCCNFK